MANVPYSALPATTPVDGDIVPGLDVGGGITSKFLVQELAAVGGLWLKGDITKTVGGGGDFATLDDAFLWLQEHKDLGSAASGLADKRGIRVTLDLAAGVYLPGGVNGYMRLENINYQVSIASTSGGATIGDDNSVLQFTNCSNVRIDNVTIIGMIALTHAYLIINWSTFTADVTDVWFQLQRESGLGGWFDNCRGLYLDGQSNASVSVNNASALTIKPRDDFAGEPIFMNEASTFTVFGGLIVDCTTFNGGSGNSRGAVHIDNMSSLRVDSGTLASNLVAITGGGTFSADPTHSGLQAEGGSRVSMWQPFVITAFTVLSTNHPALIGLDGSVYWDGETEPTSIPEVVLQGRAEGTQEPVALDTPIQVTFGPLQSNAFFSLAADGTLTCLTEGHYTLRFRFLMGRSGGSQSEAHLFIRALLNANAEFSTPVHAIVDSPKIEIPVTFEGPLSLFVGDTLTVELVRDSAGTNEGGLYAATPTVVPWAVSPSAVMTITRDII